ncbi:MAG: hypothetical protein Q8R31_02280 [Candidatus Omnitrophota bacterium]|nr:hypothetical protein [Candidatus Omnitrophota bacterium]
MKKKSEDNRLWSFIGLALSLILPSLGQVYKYLKDTGVFLYILSVFFILLILHKYCLKKFLSKITEKQIFYLTVVTFLLLIVLFFLVYPLVNSGIVGGGSDRDEDANIATNELLHGRYPYYPKTYLGNSLTHLPGSLLLSVPFVLLGNSAYQNFFWLFIFIIVAKSLLRSSHLALLLFWMILILSPVTAQEFVTGGDLLSNSIYILFFIFFLVNNVLAPNAKEWKKILSAVLLGIGLSSRANFILLLPLVFFTLVKNKGLKDATMYTGLSCLIFLTLTLPFYLYDPRGFTPLYGQLSKINQFSGKLPFSGIIIILASLIIAFLFSLQRLEGNCVTLFKNCAYVQAFLVLCAVILHIFIKGKPGFVVSGYGLNFLFFGALAFWYKLTEEYKQII